MIHAAPHPQPFRPEHHARDLQTTMTMIAAILFTTTAIAFLAFVLSSRFAPMEAPHPVLKDAGPGLTEFTVNRVSDIANKGYGYQHLKIGIAVGVDGEIVEGDTSVVYRLNDVLLTTVSGYWAVDLRTPEGKEALRQELMTNMEAALAPSGRHVQYLNFTDFVLTA